MFPNKLVIGVQVDCITVYYFHPFVICRRIERDSWYEILDFLRDTDVIDNASHIHIQREW